MLVLLFHPSSGTPKSLTDFVFVHTQVLQEDTIHQGDQKKRSFIKDKIKQLLNNYIEIIYLTE